MKSSDLLFKDILSMDGLVTRSLSENNVKMLDFGMGNVAAWGEGEKLVSMLIEGMGEVHIGEMSVKNYRFPTLDLYLDDPSKLDLPEVVKNAEGTYYNFSNLPYAVGVFDTIPHKPSLPSGKEYLVVLKEGSLIAEIFISYLVTVQTIHEMKRDFGLGSIIWGWSSTLLPSLCDDLTILRKREAAMAKNGSLVSLWVRVPEDIQIKAEFERLSPRGEIRIQNLVTANTFCYGKISEETCATALGISED